jgi:hypothetical protein
MRGYLPRQPPRKVLRASCRLLLRGFLGGLTGRNTATKISLVGWLQRRFGRASKVRNPVEYYQEMILLLLH